MPSGIRRAWRVLRRAIGRALTEDDITGRAAQLAYFFFLSIFPLLISLIALTGIVPFLREHVRAGVSELTAIPAGFRGRAGGESSEASDDRQPGDETLDRHRGDRMVREFRYFGADRCDECAVRSRGEPAVCEAPRDRNFAFGGGRDSVCACRRDHADQRGFSGTDDGGGMGRVPMARGAGARAAGAFGDLSLRAEPETEGLAMDYAGGDGRTVVMAGGVVRVSGVFAVLQYVWRGVRIAGNGDYCDAVVLHFQPGDFAGQRVECGAGERRREERPGRDPAGGPRAEADGGALEILKASTG